MPIYANSDTIHPALGLMREYNDSNYEVKERLAEQPYTS
jgi:hypothetical protein